jgi:hypothetical protein
MPKWEHNVIYIERLIMLNKISLNALHQMKTGIAAYKFSYSNPKDDFYFGFLNLHLEEVYLTWENLDKPRKHKKHIEISKIKGIIYGPYSSTFKSVADRKIFSDED